MQNSPVFVDITTLPPGTHTTATSPTTYSEAPSPGLRKVPLNGQMPFAATGEVLVKPPRAWNENR